MADAVLIFITKRFLAFMLSIFAITNCGAPVAPETAPIADGADVRIVQFNLRTTGWAETSVAYRAPLMVAELNELMPDSMGFQEANLRWMLYLEEKLTDYAYVGVGRTDGNLRGEFSPVFYLKDKYNLVDSGTFWLSDTPDKPGSKFASSQNIRICTWAVLENKETGESYAHINTHLDHISASARKMQVEVLLTKVNELIGDYPIVLTGDFNDNAASPMYAAATEVLSDARLIAPVTEDKATFHNYGKSVTEKTLDYVFVSDRVQPLVYHVIDDKVNGTYLSDHYGIYVDAALG